jgi:hypothetical protein
MRQLRCKTFKAVCIPEELFMPVSADECLFGGALPRCVSESDPKAPERIAQLAHCLDQPADSMELYGTLPETHAVVI